MPVLHWHGDNCDLPPGAERLASTPSCPVQAFRVGPAALGLQFHVEADPRRIEAWLIGHAVELGKAGVDPRAIRADAARLGAATAAAGRAILSDWLGAAVADELRRGDPASPPRPSRGRVAYDAPLAPFTWFRVGGAAEALFSPADEDDLAAFLRRLPAAVPVTVIGLGSNLIVRDGGVEGVVDPARRPGLQRDRRRGRIAGSSPARRRPTSSSPRPPRPRASTASPSCAAFPARSAARCA